MSKIENPPAFPFAIPELHAGAWEGMSLRDWFAGQALPAVITATSDGNHNPTMLEGETRLLGAMARDAYDLADAMLTQREKGSQ